MRQIIIFTRYPKPGAVKTRLIPLLGAEEAAGLHRRMTEHTLNIVRELESLCSVSIRICYEGGDEPLMQTWLGPEISCQRQHDGDLGQRMLYAFECAFCSGAKRVIIIGTDCPDLSSGLIQKAFTALLDHDLVLGPAKDGGYYLIGLQQPILQLFTGIPWGTGEVRQKTLEIADKLGLRTSLTDMLTDVDRPEDLPVWYQYAG